MTDAFDLPPTQYLVLELLGARYRLGELGWTFDTKVTKAVEALAVRGLVHYKSGSIERTLLVWLTDKGKTAAMDPEYTPPVLRRMTDELRTLRAIPFCPHHGDNDPLCHATIRSDQEVQ